MARVRTWGSWGPLRTEQTELTRRAVILDAVLTVAVVLLATLTALLGPPGGHVRAGGNTTLSGNPGGLPGAATPGLIVQANKIAPGINYRGPKIGGAA
jgi:hypothetical protein